MTFITYRRFICVKDLQKTGKCEDFEVRFCCPTEAANGVDITLTSISHIENDSIKIPPNFPLPQSLDKLRKMNSLYYMCHMWNFWSRIPPKITIFNHSLPNYFVQLSVSVKLTVRSASFIL